MKSDRGFRDFLSSGGRSVRLGIIILVGVILIFLGTTGNFSKKNSSLGEEERIAEMCALMEGVGECRVMMTYTHDKEERVYAVLVLCDGADSVEVRERVTSLVCSLYGIGSHRVEIQKLKR